jgi:hypothetical protein
MVNPAQLAGAQQSVFVSGNDADAKQTVTGLLESSASHTIAVLFAVEETTLTSADHSVLVVDLVEFDGEVLEPFRSISAELWGSRTT